VRVTRTSTSSNWNIPLDHRERHQALAEAIAAPDFPGGVADATAIRCATVTAVPIDHSAKTNGMYVRWKAGVARRKCCCHKLLSHDPKVRTRQHASAVEKSARQLIPTDIE